MQAISVYLILYPVTLSNSLMSSSSFLEASVGFSVYSMSSANSDSFTSFSLWIPFASFSFVIVMVRTSKIMLNKSGENGHSCLIPDLRGIAFSLSLLSMMLAHEKMLYITNY